jgi:glycerol-3-phosphate acyltransferase PlsY
MVLILFIYHEKETSYRVFAIFVAIMVVVTHRNNIKRLFKGNENKVPLFKKKEKSEEK